MQTIQNTNQATSPRFNFHGIIVTSDDTIVTRKIMNRMRNEMLSIFEVVELSILAGIFIIELFQLWLKLLELKRKVKKK